MRVGYVVHGCLCPGLVVKAALGKGNVFIGDIDVRNNPLQFNELFPRGAELLENKQLQLHDILFDSQDLVQRDFVEIRHRVR